MSALHEAAACGDVDKLEDLLSKSRVNKNEKDEDWDGRTPLFWATIEGHLPCVKFLLEAGANPTLPNNDEKTAAHYAAESGRCDILKSLLEYGCDASATDKYGDTAMDYALLYGHLECAALLDKALKGKLNLRKHCDDWFEQPTASQQKNFRPDVRHSKFLSLLSGLKALGTGQESSEGKRTPTKRSWKKKGNGQK